LAAGGLARKIAAAAGSAASAAAMEWAAALRLPVVRARDWRRDFYQWRLNQYRHSTLPIILLRGNGVNGGAGFGGGMYSNGMVVTLATAF